MNLNEPLIGHKFVVSLQHMKITLTDKPIKCKIKYRYELFSEKEISTPFFDIQGNNHQHEIPNYPGAGFQEYILPPNDVNSEKKVKDFLHKETFKVEVFDDALKIGTSNLDLSKIFSDDAIKSNQRSFLEDVPIKRVGKKMTEETIGAIECLFVMIFEKYVACKCERIFKLSSLQKHINQSTCKQEYTFDEMAAVKDHAKSDFQWDFMR